MFRSVPPFKLIASLHKPLILATVLMMAGALLSTIVTLQSRSHGEAHAQQVLTRLYAPDLQSQGYTTGSLPAALPALPAIPADARPASPDSIEGFGYSTLELVSGAEGVVEAAISLSKRGRDRNMVRRNVSPDLATVLRLGGLPVIDDGFWNARIEADAPIAGVARTDWASRGSGLSGGTIIYELMEPGRRFLLPLFIRGVDELYSGYYVFNADESGEDRTNHVTFRYFNDADGGLEAEWRDELEPQAISDVDSLEFGTAVTRLPANLPDEGFVGGFHIESTYPVAVLAMHNEAFDGGVGAAPVRTIDFASTEQHLPVVRANAFGDSLIGLINREDSAVNVTLTYRGLSNSPVQAGAEINQQITMAPRSSASIDLGGRGMGTVSAPALQRGGRVNGGFLGSARISSSGRVQATVVESSRWLTVTRSSAAWNAFTPADLGTMHVVPAARHVPATRITQLAIHNPGDGPAAVEVRYTAMDGPAPSGSSVAVPAGETVMVNTSGVPNSISTAFVQSDVPVAVLVYETPFTSEAAFNDRGNLLDVSAYAALRPGEKGGSPVATRVPSSTPTPSQAPEIPTSVVTPTGSIDNGQHFIWMPWAGR